MSLQPLTLARLLVARLCHDLGGIAGTLAGTLDLAAGGGEDDPMRDLARETAESLRLRLRLYAAAWGGAAEEMDAAALRALLQGAPAAPRVAFATDGLAPEGVLPAELVPLALCVALLGAEALPRGGTVRLAGTAEAGFTVWPQGTAAAWPPALTTALAAAGGDGAPPLPDGGAVAPRRLLVPLVLLLAEEAGWEVSLALGGPGAAGAAPMLLGPTA
jgi:histidine phosphotransferase ChpT